MSCNSQRSDFALALPSAYSLSASLVDADRHKQSPFRHQAQNPSETTACGKNSTTGLRAVHFTFATSKWKWFWWPGRQFYGVSGWRMPLPSPMRGWASGLS